jgi:hypothetical protein
MAVADQRQKNSFYPQAHPQEEEAKRAFANRINYQRKTQDLPCPSSGLRLQSWLLCDRIVEGVTRLLRELPTISRPTFTALLSAIDCTRTVRFDSVSYPIGIDTHALRCMVNAPHLFVDLKFGEVGEAEGIKSRLDIKGTGILKFKIKDDNGMMHKIKLPNSLYVPELKRCLLSPQHWVQEANDNHPRPKGTRMSQDDEFYYVH